MWIRFYYKIDLMASRLKLKTISDDEVRATKRTIRLSNLISAILIMSLVAFTVYVTVDAETFVPTDGAPYSAL